ncbi:MAG: GntR family transcriptional regulator [Pseudonocardiaceae bacterium]
MTSEPTPSRQIAADLRKAIRDGEYRPGHQLPSGNALARRYGVARQTV